MSWQLAALLILAAVIAGGFAWYERARPPARIVAAVAALAALGVAGRVVLAPIPNVVATTDVALLAGYTLGGGPGFAVGALSGLVSNFWLGQGPWTPWQMAGWGMVGLIGAWVAAGGGRRLGRWGLAGVAALCGLLYGALLDLSVMVTYGGEQSLDRYLALSARGIPFNIAHAAGNAALMLAAGPAMVRMLDRYRDRFDHVWRDSRVRATAAASMLALLLVPVLAAPPGADATANDTRSLQARSWLVAAQNDDGGWGSIDGGESSPGMTGWAMLGLEAAGLNPADVATADGEDAISYLRDHRSGIDSTGDLERTILALEGASEDSRDFGGADLVAKLRKRQDKDGSFDGQVNLTAFAILAQRSAGVDPSNIGKAAKWLRSVQNRNGGWASVDGGESEPDSTGAVLQALSVAPGDSEPIDAGARWLERSQHNDGGWSLTAGAESNAQSTAWAIQGLAAAGRTVNEIRADGTSGIDYLDRRQEEDGHFSYSKSSDQTPVWVTAQAITGVERSPFPVTPIEPAPEPAETDGSTGSLPDPTTPPADVGSYDGYDGYGGYGGGGVDGGSGFGNGSGSGGDSGGSATTKDAPADPGPDLGVPEEGTDPEAATEAVLLSSEREGSPLPDTWVMLAGLAAFAVILGAGFVLYRRRLP